MQAIMSTPFDGSIVGLCRDALQISLRRPRSAAFFAKTARDQRSAARRRVEAAGRGIQVPPLMVLGLTGRRNLREAAGEMALEQLRSLLTQARGLGVSIVALAGGEPPSQPDVLEITKDFPQILFPLVTNASLLSEALVERLRQHPNVIPIISLEGYEGDTDGRGGSGVSQRTLAAMQRMSERRIFFGASIVVTRPNYPLVTGREFVHALARHGCRIFFYVDYVPIGAETEHLVPTDRQRALEPLAMSVLRAEFSALFVASSAFEEARVGGSLPQKPGWLEARPWERANPFDPGEPSPIERRGRRRIAA